MFERAVFSVLSALLLALIANGLPIKTADVVMIVCYLGVSFSIVSALLCLFDESEASEPGGFKDSSKLYRWINDVLLV